MIEGVSTIKMLELFGGAGAPRKAMVNLGIAHKAIDYVEIDEKAVRAYNAMYDNRYAPQSVIGYNLRPDVLIHGSPCQDFSRAGIRLGGKGEDKTRSSLMWETLNIIRNMGIWKPRVVIWENVKGVLDKDMIETFCKYLVEMKKIGYTSNYEVLNAMDFGIPQKRERVFTISILGDAAFDFTRLKKRPLRHISEFLEPNVAGEQYRITIPSMRNRIREFAPPDVNYRFLTVIEDFCWTISTRQDRSPNAGIVPVPGGEYRYLTERECWRLMGFSDEDFNKVIREFPTKEGRRNASLYKMAGNSIVVPILEAIFEVLLSGEFATDITTAQDGQLQLIC